MKKTTLSFGFLAVSAAYIIYLYFTGPADVSSSAASSAQTSSVATATSASVSVAQNSAGASPNPGASTSVATAAPASPPPVSTPSSVQTPTSAPAPKPTGQYTDGTYTGSSQNAYYGTVQVSAVIQGGKLASVNFLQYPSDRRTSQSISNRAMPILQSEAIQAQSASVSIVSGATDTSMAFQQSLQSALAQAKA